MTESQYEAIKALLALMLVELEAINVNTTT